MKKISRRSFLAAAGMTAAACMLSACGGSSSSSSSAAGSSAAAASGKIAEAGANIFVCGSAVFGGNITKNVKEILEKMNER